MKKHAPLLYFFALTTLSACSSEQSKGESDKNDATSKNLGADGNDSSSADGNDSSSADGTGRDDSKNVVNTTPIVPTQCEGAKPSPLKGAWSDEVILDPSHEEFFVSPDGKKSNDGSQTSPWDLESVLSAEQEIPGGSVVWLSEGGYFKPGATDMQSAAFGVILSGKEDNPIHLRAELGARVSIDGGFRIDLSSWLWIWDLEMTPKTEWRPEDYHIPGNDLSAFPNARDGLNILASTDTKFINLVVHHNSVTGVSHWKSNANSEMHGSLVYDNGHVGDSRGAGPGLYHQNTSETERVVTDNILAGNFSTAMQVRGSGGTEDKDERYTHYFRFEGNTWFAPREQSGARNYLHTSHTRTQNFQFNENFIHGYEMRMPNDYWNYDEVGYIEANNQHCDGNHFIHTEISDALAPVCRLFGKNEESLPEQSDSILRPNKYDPRRANLMVTNHERVDELSVSLGCFAEAGDRIRILNSLDFFGPAIVDVVYNGEFVNIPWPEAPWDMFSKLDPRDLSTFHKEFWAFVVMKNE